MAVRFRPHALERIQGLQRMKRHRLWSTARDSPPNLDVRVFEGIFHSVQSGMVGNMGPNRLKSMPSRRVQTGW
jgi:hypothetical protein